MCGSHVKLKKIRWSSPSHDSLRATTQSPIFSEKVPGLTPFLLPTPPPITRTSNDQSNDRALQFLLPWSSVQIHSPPPHISSLICSHACDTMGQAQRARGSDELPRHRKPYPRRPPGPHHHCPQIWPRLNQPASPQIRRLPLPPPHLQLVPRAASISSVASLSSSLLKNTGAAVARLPVARK